MGFPTDFFPVLFMIPRCAGWLSHWQELQDDKELKIIRPRQHYLGNMSAAYIAPSQRQASGANIKASRSSASVRGSDGRSM